MAGPSSDYNVVDGRYVAITPEIERAAATIKAVFLQTRSNLCPTAPTRAGKAQQKHFIKAAMLCLRLKEDPATFTMARVQQMAEIGIFFPQALHSEKLSLRLEENAETRTVDHLAAYRAQLTLFNGMRAIFSVEQMLRDPVNQFSPLFRACMAIRGGVPDVARAYRAEALLELAAHPVARELFKDEVPRL